MKKEQLPFGKRNRFGTCKSDTFNLDISLSTVISNALVEYVNVASKNIVDSDGSFELIIKHAKAIRDFGTADHWYKQKDFDKDNVKEHKKYAKQEKRFKEAMVWLAENWGSLWW